MRHAHEKKGFADLLREIRSGNKKILVGTQVLSRGFHFPSLRALIYIGLENELTFPDYRSNERVFRLLSQSAGRIAREGGNGLIFLDIRGKEFPVKEAIDEDYPSFAKKEFELRKQSGFPPFQRMIRVIFRGKQEKDAEKKATEFAADMEKYNLRLMGPYPCIQEKLRGEFRWHVLLFRDSTEKWGERLRSKLLDFQTGCPPWAKNRRVKMEIIRDPLSLI